MLGVHNDQLISEADHQRLLHTLVDLFDMATPPATSSTADDALFDHDESLNLPNDEIDRLLANMQPDGDTQATLEPTDAAANADVITAVVAGQLVTDQVVPVGTDVPANVNTDASVSAEQSTLQTPPNPSDTVPQDYSVHEPTTSLLTPPISLDIASLVYSDREQNTGQLSPANIINIVPLNINQPANTDTADHSASAATDTVADQPVSLTTTSTELSKAATKLDSAVPETQPVAGVVQIKTEPGTAGTQDSSASGHKAVQVTTDEGVTLYGDDAIAHIRSGKPVASNVIKTEPVDSTSFTVKLTSQQNAEGQEVLCIDSSSEEERTPHDHVKHDVTESGDHAPSGSQLVPSRLKSVQVTSGETGSDGAPQIKVTPALEQQTAGNTDSHLTAATTSGQKKRRHREHNVSNAVMGPAITPEDERLGRQEEQQKRNRAALELLELKPLEQQGFSDLEDQDHSSANEGLDDDQPQSPPAQSSGSTRPSSPDMVLGPDYADEACEQLRLYSTLDYDSEEDRQRRQLFRLAYPPTIPFTIGRATLKAATHGPNFVFRPLKSAKRAGSDAGYVTYCRNCPHRTTNNDKHPYCIKCIYAWGYARCPPECEYCPADRKKSKNRNARLKTLTMLAGDGLKNATLMKPFIATQADTVIYMRSLALTSYAKSVEVNYPATYVRTFADLSALMRQKFEARPWQQDDFLNATLAKVQRSARTFISEGHNALEQTYRQGLLTTCYQLVSPMAAAESARQWLRLAVLAAYEFNKHQVRVEEVLIYLDASLDELTEPVLAEVRPAAVTVAAASTSHASTSQSTTRQPRQGVRTSPRVKDTSPASYQASEPPAKKLKSDSSSKKQKKRRREPTAEERAWAAARELSQSTVPFNGEYKVLDNTAALPSRHSMVVADVMSQLTHVQHHSSTLFNQDRLQNPDGPGFIMPSRNKVIDATRKQVNALIRRQDEFLEQLKDESLLYRMRCIPLPTTRNLDVLNTHAYHAPLGRVPVVGAKLPPCHLAGSAEREFDNQKMTTVFDADVKHIEVTSKLTFNQLSALNEMVSKLRMGLRQGRTMTEEQDTLVHAIQSVLTDATQSNVETMFHAVMTRRYQLVDKEAPATEDELLGLMLGLSIGATTLADGSLCQPEDKWAASYPRHALSVVHRPSASAAVEAADKS